MKTKDYVVWIILGLTLSTVKSFTTSILGHGKADMPRTVSFTGSEPVKATWRSIPERSCLIHHLQSVRHSSSLLALPTDYSSKSTRKRAWPKRIWSKIVSRGDSSNNNIKELRMQLVMDQETEELEIVTPLTPYDDSDCIAMEAGMNLETIVIDSPMSVLVTNEGASTLIDAEFYGVNIVTPTPSTTIPENVVLVETTRTADSSKPPVGESRWLGNIVENIITGIIQRNSIESPKGLEIRVQPKGNLVGSLLKGQVGMDAEMVVDQIAFRPIRMSGGRLEIKRLTLQFLGFLGEEKTRFPKQFDIHAHDLIFSKDDLLESPCIRNGLRQLLVRILRDRAGVQSSTIRITSLDVLPSGKISILGVAKTLFLDSPLNFEVRTGIDFTTRGHVLTFPGLEISVNSPLFVPVVPTIDIDVGHNARFREIYIDGQENLIRLSASVTITPEPTIRLLTEYRQLSQAFSARFSIDIGRWLTNLGNFRR